MRNNWSIYLPNRQWIGITTVQENNSLVQSDSSKVSILVPAYNAEQYFIRCVDSILNQSYQNIEVIITDDASNDATGKIADDFALKDLRVKVYHHPINQGFSGARNTCLSHATGEYITFVDADDWVESDYVEYLMNIIKKTSSDIAMSRNSFTSRLHEQVQVDRIYSVSSEDMLCDILYNRINVAVWNRLYKRSIIGDCRFRGELKTGEGLQFNTQVVPRASKVGVGLRRIYTYNVDNNNSATKKPNINKQAYGAIETMEIIKKTLVPRSARLNDAVDYQCFATELYAMIHLVRAKACKEHRDFYRYLVHEIRHVALRTFTMEISMGQKMKSLIAWISPRLTVEASIFWRYRLKRKQRV